MSSPSRSQPKSHILLLGGTGRIGTSLLTSLLSKDHDVTALVRRPNSLPPHPSLTQITGTPTSKTSVSAALTSIPDGVTVTVISTLGQTRYNQSNPWSGPTSPALLMTESARALVEALRDVGRRVRVAKVVVLSMFGAGDSWPYMHWLFRGVMMYSYMRRTVEDHDNVIEVFKANFGDGEGMLPVGYVVVRPAMLRFGVEGEEEVGEIREWGVGSREMGFMPKIDARSVVRFMVERVDDDGRFDGSMPVISN